MALNDFLTDDDLSTQGVWMPFMEGEIKLAAFDNPEFTEFIRKKNKPYADMGRKPPEDIAEEFAAEGIARYIIRDWKNVRVDKDSEPLEYTIDNAKMVVKKYKKVMRWIVAQSQDLTNFQRDTSEETEGNSESV